MLRKRLFRRGSTEPPDFDPAAVPASPTTEIRDIGGQEFHCRAVESPDEKWRLVFGRVIDGSDSYAFVIDDGTIVTKQRVSRPVNGTIANDGTAALVCDTRSTTIGSTLLVLESDGGRLSRQFDATLDQPAIRATGELVAVAARPPLSTVYLIDSRTTDDIGSYPVRGRTPQILGFHGDDGYLYVGVRATTDPYVGFDADADVVWGSDRYWASRPLTDRVESALGILRP
ncbi:uncharacterized protein Nmag_2365 [Natrialba magadii ATCC 43099]|uniref:Uncharacterized protein n=1 Tax=Natrialba magadii (strain ATCC 43099 / DSM 3394 / CCM 3739 / CIP 104546 / IAM 13178 / JCM 8861 / NBRC 102185 / NCIMB 2190 / MS3) TaxID=547559 RepID=D3SXH8_NATMM|nr:hypothetical protein [Natrialba magadii]ADD05927.1 uncharacterized protein Nmag_2365 [Natrialba magadii ATCC 43099]ELY30566.1 hypothetical protein C500_08592 [Natrialba magadii ATCC 43099]